MELNIYFKNVGQGDTIVLDWHDGNKKNRKYALIDCNLVNGNINPLIKHIENHGINTFEFVLMSHPHSDHFSGFPMFFDYCEEKRITIKKFLHTAFFHPNNLSTAFEEEAISTKQFNEAMLASVNRGQHKNLLKQLFLRLHKESKKNGSGFIHDVHPINNDYSLHLINEVFIRFLAPYQAESLTYIKGNYRMSKEDRIQLTQKTDNNPQANLLSSLLQIFSDKDEWQIFLSSDTTTYTFDRLLNHKNHFKSVINKRLLVAQIPHHGSDKNHVPSFWENLPKLKDAPILISVGNGYGHPDKAVIDFFAKNAMSVHATNNVGGYQEFCMGQNANFPLHPLDLLSMPGIAYNLKEELHNTKNNCPQCCEKRLIVNLSKGECEVVDVP